jgi:hypothetical protein
LRIRNIHEETEFQVGRSKFGGLVMRVSRQN